MPWCIQRCPRGARILHGHPCITRAPADAGGEGSVKRERESFFPLFTMVVVLPHYSFLSVSLVLFFPSSPLMILSCVLSFSANLVPHSQPKASNTWHKDRPHTYFSYTSTHTEEGKVHMDECECKNELKHPRHVLFLIWQWVQSSGV